MLFQGEQLRIYTLVMPERPQIAIHPTGTALLPGNGVLQHQLAELVALAAEGARSNSASLYIVDESTQTLKPGITYNLPADYIAGCGDVAIGDQCCGRAVAHKREWVVVDMLSDPLFASAREAAKNSPIRAGFSVPVLDRSGRVIAALACHYEQPFKPSNYDIERNKLFAKLISAAIEEQAQQQQRTAAAD